MRERHLARKKLLRSATDWGYESVSEVEAVAENHLGNQMIRGMGHADAKAEIHFPLRGEIEVDRWKDLMLLLTGGEKIRCRTDRTVVFESAGDFFREVVAELEIRRERHSLMDAVPMEGTVKRGVKGQIPGANLFVDNGPHFPSPGVGGKFAPLVADFVREADTHRPPPLFGDTYARPDVVADPVAALAILCGSKNGQGWDWVGDHIRPRVRIPKEWR